MDAKFEALFDDGAAIDHLDDEGKSALHNAVMANYKEYVLFLLGRGANATLADKQGQTPLHFAGTAEIATALLDHGAAVDAVDSDGKTPLLAITSRRASRACIVAIVRVIVEAGANVNASDSNGDTALHHCARMRYWVSGPSGLVSERRITPEPLRFLIDRGADVGLHNNSGQRASDLAARGEEKTLLLAAEQAQLEASRGQFKRPRLEDLRPPVEVAGDAAAAPAAAGKKKEDEEDEEEEEEDEDEDD